MPITVGPFSITVDMKSSTVPAEAVEQPKPHQNGKAAPGPAAEKYEHQDVPITWPKTYPAHLFVELQFPPIRWIVPNIFPEGATLLAGRPKSGKTFLAVNVAWAVAAGGKAMGKVDVEQGRVLYLALEGSKRNMQDRLKALAQSGKVPESLDLGFEWPRLDEGGLEQLHYYLSCYPQTRLVVIDTFKRIKSAGGAVRKTASMASAVRVAGSFVRATQASCPRTI